MNKRTLGDSGIEISEVGLGSWITYGGGVAKEQAEACTRAAFDEGITFFDTANFYGRGAAEEVWGEILAQYPRDSFVLATKVFFPMADDHRGGLSATEIETQLDASLQRLRTDYVDLYQCHRPDPQVPIEETMEALTRAVESGKVRAIGYSEWTEEQVKAALDVPGTVKFVSSQPQYSMVWRGPELFEDLVTANGISHVVWSPLAQGVLTGKYLPGQEPQADSRAASPEMGFAIGQFLQDELLEAVQGLKPIAAELGISMAQLALAWALRRDEVAAVIVGASRPEQVRDNAGASGVTLSADVLARIDEVIGDQAVTEFRLGYGMSTGVLHR